MGILKQAVGLALISLAGLSGCQRPAAEPETAEEVYRRYCLSCHGSGSRDMALIDLTTLAAANGGAFPMEFVIAIIDGRDGVRAHGSPMPVWGEIYSAETVRDLAEYLASIQQ